MSENIKKYRKPLFSIFYESYYQELLSDALSRKWQQIGIITTFLVTATASGSAISGWALWSTSAGKFSWAFVAAIASIASIAYGVFGVPGRVKEQGELHSIFSQLRIAAEMFYLQLVSLDDNEAKKQFEELTKKFSDVSPRAGSDIAATTGLCDEVQKQLHTILKTKGYIQ